MKLVVLYILAVPLVVLGFAGGLGAARLAPYASILPGHQGTPHGLTEVTYAFTSAGNNNGSAFGGLTGEHRLVQRDARPLDARRSLLPDRAGPGHRRIAGPQAGHPAVRRHLPDGHARSSPASSSASS